MSQYITSLLSEARKSLRNLRSLADRGGALPEVRKMTAYKQAEACEHSLSTAAEVIREIGSNLHISRQAAAPSIKSKRRVGDTPDRCLSRSELQHKLSCAIKKQCIKLLKLQCDRLEAENTKRRTKVQSRHSRRKGAVE